MVDSTLPDVVLTDIRMPPTCTDEGIQAAAGSARHHPAVGVVVLSQYATPGYAHALFEDGSDARAYLLKDRVADVDEVLFAIEAVANGGSVVDPKIVEELVSARARKPRSPLDQLTTREREILAEIAPGKSNTAIANTLFLSSRAIEKHSNSIFSKLGLTEEPDVNRRVKAVLLYLAAERRVALVTDVNDRARPDAGADVTVLVVDDQSPFRDAARAVVDRLAGFEVIGGGRVG